MTSSENFPSLEPWTFRPSFSDSWISEAFARDHETLTKALQKSLCTTEPETLINSADTTPINNTNSYLHFVKPEPTLTSSISDPDSSFPKRRNGISNGKITKRKSRASKRSPTTFIKADPANFRQMVQQVTGIRFGDVSAATPVLKPEPQRPVNRLQNFCLPTLDTSAFLLGDGNQQQQQQFQQQQQVVGSTQGHVSYAPVAEGGGGLGFEGIQNFPTLESWRVIM